jgi:ornithine cyclodeaminase
MDDCIDVMAETLSDLARGEGVQPLRSGFLLPNRRGVLAWMPGSLASGRPYGVKILSVFEGAAAQGLDSHQGGVMIFDPDTGQPLALLEAGAVTAVRTAAVSAVATDRLARKDSRVLAILGSGAQARSHMEAMCAVRTIGRVWVWSRTTENAESFAVEQAGLHRVPVEVAPDVASAVEGADIICTTTASKEPILPAELLREGMHLNIVGSSIPSCAEIDAEVVRLSSYFTDRRESLANEAREYIEALGTGVLKADEPVPELGEVLTGAHPGRTSDSELTIFRSLGLAVEDIASAQLVYERAVERDVGIEVDLAG